MLRTLVRKKNRNWNYDGDWYRTTKCEGQFSKFNILHIFFLIITLFSFSDFFVWDSHSNSPHLLRLPLSTLSDSLELSFAQLPLISVCVNLEQPCHQHTRHTGELCHLPNTTLPPFFFSSSSLFLSLSQLFSFFDAPEDTDGGFTVVFGRQTDRSIFMRLCYLISLHLLS